MKKLIIIYALLFMACTSTTAPTTAVISYKVELINGSMSHVYFIGSDGNMEAIECTPGDSVYQYGAVFDTGANAGAGAYPGDTSVVSVIIRENGERVVAEYILESEATMLFWTVGK